ncbi:hypothetical protein GCM10009087_07710 [Sphingomonas oligophenolica]|uniref:DUF4328 domain-containing protein n=1 Tax=Sphingomonas oligophenolica TaxID=301154 RepID=A0ABU9XXJ3_9SPHN
MIVIDAALRPAILLVAWLSPGTFSVYITPVAGMADGFVFGFKILTMILFCRWIYVAGRNLVEVGMDELEFTPASRIWWFFVPVASLFKPFQAMRELWNASRNIWPHDTNDSLVSVWWGLWLATNILAYISNITNRDSRNLTTIVVHIAAEIAVAVAAIALVRGIAKGQDSLAGSEIAEVFA